MKIFLFQNYSNRPNPVYQQIAASFRSIGNTVWLAEPESGGRLVIKNENGIEEIVADVPSAPARSSTRSPRRLLSRKESLLALRRLKQAIRERSPDIVQVNPTSMAWFLPVGMPSSIRFVFDIRQINEAVDRSLGTRLREQLNIWRMALVGRHIYKKICFCHEQAAIRVLGDNWRDSGVVVPVGVDDRFIDFQHPAKTFDTRSPRSFVYIGTLSRLRNLEKLLEAAQHLLREGTEAFRLDLVGPDTSDGYYQRVIERLGIQAVSSVKSAVSYDDIPELLSQYDVGLAYVPDRPTWHYQPTIKTLEYRALGLPIVSTDVASHREVVEQNRNGILCEDTPRAIAEAMHQLISSQATFRTVQRNARNMRQGISWLSVANMYLSNVYQPLMRETSHR